MHKADSRSRSGFGVLVWVAVAVTGGACTGSVTTSSQQEGSSSAGAASGPPGTFSVPGSPSAQRCVHQVPLRRLSKLQYGNVIRDAFAGQVTASARFPQGEMGASRTGFSTEPAVNEITTLGAEETLVAAEDVALSVAEHLPTLLPCSQTEPTPACAGTFVATYGPKLYRRPLRADETTALLALHAEAVGATAFADGIALVTAAMLQSPDFQYVIETGTPSAEDPTLALLNPSEVAHRLSFLFWDALPDQPLLDAAAAGALQTPDGLRAQALRMLADPRARATLSRFAREWLQLPALKAGDRIGLTDELATAQLQELDLFVQDAFMGEGTLGQLLAGRETFIDGVAAQSYGASAAGVAAPGQFAKVPMPEAQRAGLLTMPAIMTAKAHVDEPSYVTRGLFVLQKLLCVELATPPANATQMLPVFPPDATQRDKSALIRGQNACAGCHNLIDPIGLAFEGFDHLGRVRPTLPDGKAVNTTGKLSGVQDVDTPFENPRQLAEIIATAPEAASCMAKTAFRFAFSKLEDDADACTVEGLTKTFSGKSLSLRELLVSLTQLEGFRYRRIGGTP